MIQSVAATVPKDNIVRGREHSQSRMEQELGNWRDLQSEMHPSSSIVDFPKDPVNKLDPLYLRATIDLGAHLILDAEVNSLAALTFVDLGATGVFMYPKFIEQCH